MRILVIDIETTGFLAQGGTIVEVGIVRLNLKTGKKTILMDAVTHEGGITKEEVRKSWVVHNSSLSVEQIRYSEKFSSLVKRIQRIINDYPDGATAFNKEFDFSFLKSRGIKFVKELPCPMLKSTPVVKLPSKYPQYGPYKWPTVEEAFGFFFPGNTKYIEEHRGADDAWHEADIVLKLHELGKFMD